MVRILAIIFGVLLIFLGVAGFLPQQFMKDGLLLGYFEANQMHNLVHLVTGVIAILCATSYRAAKWFFKIFGIIYAIFAILGFFWKGDFNMIMMHLNRADNYLHVVIAIIFLYLGFLA